MRKISAIMALKISGRHYPDNIGRCDILFESLRHFGLRDLFSEFLIVVQAREEAQIRRHANAWRDFPLRLVVEDDYLGLFKKFSKPHEVRPWHRQQIIKLFCSTIVENPFFLVVDPDVFAVRRFSYDDVFPGGRALLEPEERSVHRDWWIDSADLLGVEPQLDRVGMSVTPAILSKDACIGLIEHIQNYHGRTWYEVLLSRYATNWTEYTLYCLYLELSGRLLELHAWPENHSGVRLHSKANVWDRSDLKRVELSSLFAPENPGLFAVVQSNTGFSPQHLSNALRPWIDVSVQNYKRSNGSLVSRVQELYGAGIRRMMRQLRVSR
jgi:hypothetical protein